MEMVFLKFAIAKKKKRKHFPCDQEWWGMCMARKMSSLSVTAKNNNRWVKLHQMTVWSADEFHMD